MENLSERLAKGGDMVVRPIRCGKIKIGCCRIRMLKNQRWIATRYKTDKWSVKWYSVEIILTDSEFKNNFVEVKT